MVAFPIKQQDYLKYNERVVKLQLDEFTNDQLKIWGYQYFITSSVNYSLIFKLENPHIEGTFIT